MTENIFQGVVQPFQLYLRNGAAEFDEIFFIRKPFSTTTPFGINFPVATADTLLPTLWKSGHRFDVFLTRDFDFKVKC